MKLVDADSYDKDKSIHLLRVFGAINLNDEQNVATDISSSELENDEGEGISRADKAIILGLEEIIEQLQYNNSNIDNLREEFEYFRTESSISQEARVKKNKFDKKLFTGMAYDVSTIRSILFWVLIGIPVISFIFMMVIMS